MTADDCIENSVVIPVYGNRETVVETLAQVEELSFRLTGRTEAVLVIDGSPDDSEAVLRAALPEVGISVQILVHARNFGSFAAIRTGLGAARGQRLAVMAADLQEPIELIEKFFDRLGSGADVVVGTRASRDDPRVGRAMSNTYWWAYRRFVQPEIPPGGIDVFGCSREVARQILALEESHTSLVGLLYWVGFRREEVSYHRRRRQAGESGWSTRKKVRYLMDSVYAFTDLPIAIVSGVGVVGALVTLVVGAVVLFSRLAGLIDEAGYAALMLTILFSTFLLLSGIGIVGSYVWRTYENTKGRPTAITMTHDIYDTSATKHQRKS